MSGTCHWSNWKQTIIWRAMFVLFFCFCFFCIFTISAFYSTLLHILRVPYSSLAKRQSKFYSLCYNVSVNSTWNKLWDNVLFENCLPFCPPWRLESKVVSVNLSVVYYHLKSGSYRSACHLSVTWMTKGYTVFANKTCLCLEEMYCLVNRIFFI